MTIHAAPVYDGSEHCHAYCMQRKPGSYHSNMPRLNSSNRVWIVAWGLAFGIGTSGCEKPPSAPSGEPAPVTNAPAVNLKLLVFDDPGLAGAIRRRGGEWQARGGGELEIVELTASDLPGPASQSAGKLEADAVIYPSRYVGQLAARAAIVPLRAKVLQSDKYASADVFSLIWTQEATWGQETMALPLGSPLLTLVYRSDLLEKAGTKVPTTWQEYEQLAQQFATPPDGIEAARDATWFGTVEPLGAGFAGRTLLARAACYARNANNYSTLFHIDTMEPLVAGPPFVRALDELVASARRQQTSDGQVAATDSAAARRLIESGQCAMALTWPTAAGADKSASKFPLAFGRLPGSTEVFDIRLGNWQPRAAGSSATIPFVGYSGRLASVTSTCRNVLAAQRLIAWLSGAEISSQISPASPETTLFRTGQVANPAQWVAPQVSAAAARQYATITADSLAQKESLSVPRIPGVEEYLATLDAAVLDALAGKHTSQEALTAAAAEWRAITERLDSEKQLAAYRTSLGL